METILILDDELVVRQSLADHFEDRFWRPVQAASSEEALELLEKEQPVAAIVDIRLPGKDGSTFIREALKRNVRMVFVICTGSPEYVLAPDLLNETRVSKSLFRKPVTDLGELEEAVLMLAELFEPSGGREK